MFVNRGAPQAIYLEDIDFGTEGGMATAADILVKQARARVRVDRLKEGQVKVCTCIVSHEVEQSPHVDSTSTIHSSSLCTVYFNSLLSGLAYCLHWSIACISELSAIRCIMQ